METKIEHEQIFLIETEIDTDYVMCVQPETLGFSEESERENYWFQLVKLAQVTNIQMKETKQAHLHTRHN